MSKVRLGPGRVGRVLLVAAAFAGCNGAATAVTGATSSGEPTGSGGAASTTSATGDPPCMGEACGCPACTAVDLDCLGLVDNSGKTRFGLRISDLAVSKPAVLASGLVATALATSVSLPNKGCFIDGSGAFSWLLRFDTVAGTLETGGARPVADPTLGYGFLDEMLNGIQVQPVVSMAAIDPGTGAFSVAAGADLALPIFLDPAGTTSFVLPLTGARLAMGTLSASRSCIGHIDVPDPGSTFCLGKHAQYTTGASVDGVIGLEAADASRIVATNQSLCALLAGQANSENDANGFKVCKRDANMKILFQGDACSTPGQACGDAVAFAADYVASSVLIND